MPKGAMNVVIEQANQEGLKREDFVFITPCAPMPDIAVGSAKREGLWLAQYHEEFKTALQRFTNAKVICYLGAAAGRQLHNRPIKITRVQGKIQTDPTVPAPVLPMYSPGHILKRPELRPSFDADVRTLGFLKVHDWRVSVIDEQKVDNVYEWVTDIQDLLDNPPAAIAIDTEYNTEGKRWYEGVELVTLQISYKEGHALVLPMAKDYYPGFNQRARGKLFSQVRQLLANPDVCVAGTNLKSDLHVLRQNGIEVANWNTDTVQLCFVVDDNMLDKGLDESTRRFIPDLAGYADRFNATYDKNFIKRVPLDEMLKYSGGDPDASLRLAKCLTVEGMKDSKNWNCYRRIQMPALRTFFEMEERGLAVNPGELGQLGDVLHETETELRTSLIARVDARVKRRHIDKGIKLSRPEFVIDVLFSPKSEGGFGLKPLVFTKETRKLPDDQKVPSTSAKDHLPYFDTNQWVQEFIQWKKLTKMQSTYVGRDAWTETKTNKKLETKVIHHPPTGFWKYMHNGCIHPVFDLHVTTTGRSNSRDPNAQNFPKRGKLAKAFRKIFIPRAGWCLIEADLSQAELRIAAWMANEPTMLEIYRTGGDIHTATAAAIMEVPLAEFKRWKGSAEACPDRFKVDALSRQCETLGQLFDLKRYQAKAVIF